MPGTRKAFMGQLSQQILRFIEGVRQEGGIRRTLFNFPDHPVVVVVLRQETFEALQMPESGKGAHRYEKATVVLELCGWCNQLKDHASHSL